MTDTSAAAALASSLRTATTGLAQKVYRASKPEHAAGVGVNVVSKSVDGSSATTKFDASGQLVPSSNEHKKSSAAASAVDLFA